MARPLYSQLCWFVRLRWVAGAAVILLSLADWHWLGFYHAHAWMVGVGAAILGYNALLRLLTRPPVRAAGPSQRPAGPGLGADPAGPGCA